jgi:hypothetical protein
MDKKEFELLEDGLEEFKEEESELKKALRKIYIIIIALFLVLLILANTLAGSFLVFSINGRISSVTIKDHAITFAGRNIYFEPAISDRLRQYYLDNQKTEIKLCLTGKKEGTNYSVTGIYAPEIYKKDVFSVTSQMCNKETVIDLHTHPFLHCIFSNQDIDSYEKYRKYNPDALMALMCEENRFSMYGY